MTLKIGVDSGTATMLNLKHFENIKAIDTFENLEKHFYNLVSHEYDSNIMGNVGGQGIVTSTGYGDGIYELFAVEDVKDLEDDSQYEIIGLNLIFFEDAEEV